MKRKTERGGGGEVFPWKLEFWFSFPRSRNSSRKPRAYMDVPGK